MNIKGKTEKMKVKYILKRVIYERIIKELDEIFYESIELDDIVKMTTINAMLKDNFPYMSFVGFYRVDKNRQRKEKVLKIGPYQGKLTDEIEIAYLLTFTRGVCGQCTLQEKTINVPDVSKFCGYIACDNETKSEIVVPVFRRSKLIAVLDIESMKLDSFDKVDEFYLEYLVDKYFDE